MVILLQILAFAVAVFMAVVLIRGNSRNNRLLARVRSEWGGIVEPRKLDDDLANEAWLDHSAHELTRSAIDDRTWSDLTLDDVVATIDRTHTVLGRQVLYRQIRSGAEWTRNPELEKMAALFGRDAQARMHSGYHLASASDSLGHDLWRITRPGAVYIRWWYWFFPVLTTSMIASIALMFVNPGFVLAVVALVLLNMLARVAAVWQVPRLLNPMRQMGPLIRTARQLTKTPNIAAHSSANEIADDIKSLRPLELIASWVSRDPLTAGELVASLYEYLNNVLLLDANALLFSERYLRRLAPVLGRVLDWTGGVDVALSVASLRAEPREWCIPRWNSDGATTLSGMWHPLIAAPVANDVSLESGRGLIVTGANMTGKSTYLRSIGVAIALARSLNTAPATTYSGPPLQVRSLIGRNDDIMLGKSYYQVEADGVVELLRRAEYDSQTVFLLDELLRGTNTVERLAAGEAVLRALLRGDNAWRQHSVVVATHDGELVNMLHDLYDPWHFSEMVDAGVLSFDFRRHPGPATTRTALALLAASGAPERVVQAARRRAAELDKIRPSPT